MTYVLIRCIFININRIKRNNTINNFSLYCWSFVHEDNVDICLTHITQKYNGNGIGLDLVDNTFSHLLGD